MTIKQDIVERLRFEVEIAGPLVPVQTRPPEIQLTTEVPVVTTTQKAKQAPAEKTKAKADAITKTRAAGKASSAASGGVGTADAYVRIHKLIPSDSPLVKMKGLAEVEEYVAKTILIELDRVRLNPVFGVGNPNADLMVIGEAPGANEDEQGEPFVGRAGKLLTDILGAIKFAREDVYIANILKSRPTKNRNPTTEEVAAHIPILHKQIALIKPKLMLCVGKVAANSLLGNTDSLKSMRGKFHDYHGLPVMITFHPAALLRNPEWKRPTWEDVQLLRSKFDELVG